MKRILFGLLGLALGVAVYTQVAMRTAHGTPPPMAAAQDQADAVVVDKAARRLTLMREGAVLAEYAISLGGAPAGHKQREGDERTPEGTYVIDWRNGQSIAHLSLHISYPNADDRTGQPLLEPSGHPACGVQAGDPGRLDRGGVSALLKLVLHLPAPEK